MIVQDLSTGLTVSTFATSTGWTGLGDDTTTISENGSVLLVRITSPPTATFQLGVLPAGASSIESIVDLGTYAGIPGVYSISETGDAAIGWHLDMTQVVKITQPGKTTLGNMSRIDPDPAYPYTQCTGAGQTFSTTLIWVVTSCI